VRFFFCWFGCVGFDVVLVCCLFLYFWFLVWFCFEAWLFGVGVGMGFLLCGVLWWILIF